MAIDDYSINGYWWLFYKWLLVVFYKWLLVVFYKWLLVIILLMAIGGYFINGY